MASVGFNALWLLCVLLLLVAFFLAIRRRRLAARAEEVRQANQPTTFIRPTDQVRIHMSSRPGGIEPIQRPPPAFDPAEEQPPPSYQDFRKDVQIQTSN